MKEDVRQSINLIYNYKKLNMGTLRGYRDLIVFQKSYGLAMEVFEIKKTFPKDARYSPIYQISSSSRSIAAIPKTR
jgi:hypothetical protein